MNAFEPKDLYLHTTIRPCYVDCSFDVLDGNFKPDVRVEFAGYVAVKLHILDENIELPYSNYFSMLGKGMHLTTLHCVDLFGAMIDKNFKVRWYVDSFTSIIYFTQVSDIIQLKLAWTI